MGAPAASIGPFAMAALALAAALATAALILLLRPLLVRYALARPNARSSHKSPTPQGAGIAVVAAVAALGGWAALSLAMPGADRLGAVLIAAVALAVVGAVDDIRPLPALPRLVVQTVAVTAVVAMLPGELRVVPALPLAVERAAVVFAGVWFVNLTNFMDGIDWMTVAEMVPLAAGVVVLGLVGAGSPGAMIVALLLCGALVGFAPFNRPVASVFLGDVGSLPVGLLAGWCLLELAVSGALAAAILLPLYYLADATLTLLRRMARGERLSEAHRDHYYQRAAAGGLGVAAVVARVALANAALVALAIASVVVASPLADVALVAAGCAVVGVLLAGFARRRA